MFKSGSKKSETEIDLHQEASRFDKNQVNSGQLVTSFQGHKCLLFRPGRSADLVGQPAGK